MEHEILDLTQSFGAHATAMMPLLERYGYEIPILRRG